jgi:hypothetical protein
MKKIYLKPVIAKRDRLSAVTAEAPFSVKPA